jgi:hypothetical protein
MYLCLNCNVYGMYVRTNYVCWNCGTNKHMRWETFNFTKAQSRYQGGDYQLWRARQGTLSVPSVESSGLLWRDLSVS